MTDRLIAVQTLRALAALLVVIAHAAHDAAHDADAVAARLDRPVMEVAKAFD
jgi:peptidoglycan/LPS O-acetylase OafA/YrhL